ncbi:MAG: hypothetical protein CMI16_04105 [Opitutaceae bacterium]|nr:hypothetical protein [Opitutaceae bacterium]
MSDLSYDTIKSELSSQPLFEDKTWQLSPEAWRLTPEQAQQLDEIGVACLGFHQALETLYLRAATDKNLLRNKPLKAPWVVDYLDRGKPASLIAHAKKGRNRGKFPTVLRPDLLWTDTGFVMSELDSVPGGIGLTAFLNRLYGEQEGVVGSEDAMIELFYRSLTALCPSETNPLIALVVSDEAGTYRPEMQWLAEQMQLKGRRVFCLHPNELFPLENALFFDADGDPEKIDVIYRFFELFDLPNITTQQHIFEAWQNEEVVIAPPMRAFQEEKLAMALFHHHLLPDFWSEALSKKSRKLLTKLIPKSCVMDSAPLPPGAVLDGPQASGRPLSDWRDLIGASQKERELIIKISGYHETAWGARSVTLGSDSSREEWKEGVERALELAPTSLHVLQEFRKPSRVKHRIYDREQQLHEVEGRLRLCPYYFVEDGATKLGGALATFCPPDKKIIHGMQDAALLPSRVLSLS